MDLKTALIVGTGAGLSASLARLFARNGLQVAMASRDPDKLAKLAEETAGVTFACEATEPEEVAALFDVVIATQGVPDIVVYNASARARGPVTDLDPAEVARAIAVSGYGGFLVAQQAARHMVQRGSGAILLTGASASVKGYPNSSAFAMGKFALRGLAQSLARELSPKGVHVAHFVIDGGIRSSARPDGQRTTLTAHSIRTQLRRPIGMSRPNPVAPGRGRSNCVPGWRSSSVVPGAWLFASGR